jgi:hypothetical protein
MPELAEYSMKPQTILKIMLSLKTSLWMSGICRPYIDDPAFFWHLNDTLAEELVPNEAARTAMR